MKDTVITSNISTVFPKGIPVGRIKRFLDLPGNVYVIAEIDLFTKIENLEQVMIMQTEKKGKIDEEEYENISK